MEEDKEAEFFVDSPLQASLFSRISGTPGEATVTIAQAIILNDATVKL